MSLETITEEILALNLRIKELEKLREEELKKEEYWHLDKHEKTLKSSDKWTEDTLTISSNYESFEYSKENNKEDFLYIEIEDNHTDNSIALSVTQAKFLINYLTKVVNYMEDK